MNRVSSGWPRRDPATGGLSWRPARQPRRGTPEAWPPPRRYAGDLAPSQLGDGSHVDVEGNGNDSVAAGNGNNPIVGGLGPHKIKVGNGTNILIDGSATVVNPGDSFRQILNAWTANPVASNQSAIRSRFTVNYNAKYTNTLTAGSGIDWFFYQPPTTSNKKSTDFLN